MTNMPPSVDICPRCGVRPITHSELDGTGDPPKKFQLCDPCFVDEMERRMDAAVRQWGGELEKAFREAGSPLPEGATGEEVVRNTFEEMRRQAETPEFKARMKPIGAAMARFTEELAAELPGGREHPDFADKLMARMRLWMEKHGPFDGEASA